MKIETLRVRNMVDATRFWVHGCEPGRVADGSRLALCQTLSIECPSSIFFWPVYFCYSCSFLFVVFCVFVFFFCSHWSLVDVPLIFFCPADHVPDWQPRILLGMVEARSVNVKKTTTTTTTKQFHFCSPGKLFRNSLHNFYGSGDPDSLFYFLPLPGFP